ncbi:MAG: hypothetical protein R3C20_20820 [Planctomycetaceae bacterium]
MDENNLYKPSIDRSGSRDSTTRHSTNENSPRSTAFTAFLFASAATMLTYAAANLYARSYDPWLTPRFTEYMRIWWAIGKPMLAVMMLLVPIGIVLLLRTRSTSRRLIITFLVVTMTALPVLLGVP